MINPYFFIVFAVFSLFVFWFYGLFHKATSNKYYKIKYLHRNWILETSFCLILGVLNVVFGIYFHYTYDIRAKDFSEQLIFLAAGINFFFVVLFYVFKNKYKETILIRKNREKIYDEVIKNLDKESWWERSHELLNSLATGKIDFEDNEVLPLVMLQKCSQELLHDWGIPKPKHIRKHPYYSEFKRRVKEINLSETLQRIGINVLSDDGK